MAIPAFSVRRFAILVAATCAACWQSPASAVPTLSLTSGSYAQSFDGMTNTATSALPSGWVFVSGTTPTWTSGTLATTTQLAGTVGSGTLSSSSAGGAYLFVNGTAATGTDKAIGFMSSNSFASPRSILFGMTNDTGSTISALDVGWIYEKYRNGTRAFDWKFYGSADGSTWTSISGGDKSYPADAAIAPIPVASSTVSPLRISGLSVTAGSPYYLRWDYAGLAGSSNAQALGIDTFSLVVSGSTPAVYGTYWDPIPAAGIGGSGTWTATGATFATTVDGTAVGTLATSATATFAGTAGAVTVGGTVSAGGLAFAVDGYSLAGGTIRLPATATVTAADGVTVSVGSALTQTAGGTTTFSAGQASSILMSGTIAGSGGMLKSGSGDLVLAGNNTFSGTTTVAGGWIRLGAGGSVGSVAGPIAVATADTAVVIDRSDDLTVTNLVSGSGGLFKEGGNTVTVTGANSYTGGTTLFAGTLVVGDGGTAGSISPSGPLDLAAGTSLVFDRSDDVSFQGTVAGEGTLVQRGDGRLLLSQTGSIGPSFTLRAEAGIVTLDRSGGPITGMLGAGNQVQLAGGTLELSATTGVGTRLTGAAIVVESNGMLAIRRTGSPGNHVTTGFDCPITIANSGTLAFDYRGAFVSPSLPPIRYRGTTTSTGTVTLEGDATFAVTNTAGGTGEVILGGALVAPAGAGFTKTGNQTLTLACSGTISGPTRVTEGTLLIAAPGIVASSSVAVAGSAVLAIGPAMVAGVNRLSLAATGLVDVTSGGITIASGLTPAALVARIIEGRGDGSWNGTSGITSSTAAADLARSIPRSVGWLDNGGGSLTASYAAPGDTNLDWTVDILDAANFLAGGKFDAGAAASWNEGDFGYDGVVDILDAADFLSTGLFDSGPYGTAAAAGTIAAVPEPALPIGLGAVAWLVSARCCTRIRRTSAIVRG
ncbi:MAG: autotransporter-associated beta strand repeat-containing protein [Planctomycetes bacterium]|nr:autotransporter-associated beta strand repeat-containing protein [Planctomycetota bacterium]